MKIRAMYLIMFVLTIGLLVYSAPAMANHGSEAAFPADGHWDNWTVNDTDNVGLKGYLFIPSFLRLDCDSRAIHGPPAGFSKSDGVFADEETNLVGSDAKSPLGAGGGCTEHAWHALSAWTNGGFFDPRGGTDFIPPSGDHHRSGWRMLMRTPFSGGAWLSGFAPALGTFPNFNMTGLRGAGEGPDATRAYCRAAQGLDGPLAKTEAERTGIGHYGDLTLIVDADGDGDKDCEDAAILAGAALLAFVDHHGEPLTPGRFPRYIPHERQGWPSTVVTKYTTSSANDGHGISQFFQTSAEFLDGADSTTPVSWFSMSDESAGGCGGSPWCEWWYDPVTHTLCKRETADAGVRTFSNDGGADGLDVCNKGDPEEVTTEEVVDDLNAGTDGKVIITHTLRKFEKAPVIVYQQLGLFVEMDTDAASPNFDSDFIHTTNNPKGFTHNSGPGDLEQSGQAVWYEFWGLSGPNHQAEEGHDPYTWIICGGRGPDTGEEDCNDTDSGNKDALGATWAIVKPPGSKLGGLDVIARYGSDLRPTTGSVCANSSTDDPAICGEAGVVVACVDSGPAPANVATANCDSFPGTDGVYGTADDGTIYYREASENKLRAFTRENRAHSFSFLNGIGVNHPDLCGDFISLTAGQTSSGKAGVTTECGDSPSTGTRQVMYQNIQDLGATLSCFNCSSLGQHIVPDHGFDRYNFKWTALPGVRIPDDHPNDVGSIPGEGVGGEGTPGAAF